MITIPSSLNLQVNKKLFIKDPYTSELGAKIISTSIDMINELGYEDFTLRKLALAINSSEASIYRYFENKQKLLFYLISWYWSWMEYKLIFTIANIDSPKIRLERAISLLTEKISDEEIYNFINTKKLNSIVFKESSKTFLTKEVDKENKDGVFEEYKKLVEKVAKLVLDYCPKYKYPNMLISTVIEGAHLQHYFAEHLPRLTNYQKDQNYITNFYSEIIFNTLSKSKK